MNYQARDMTIRLTDKSTDEFMIERGADLWLSTQVNAFIVRKGAPGFHSKKIENKIALRCVQNADMMFEVSYTYTQVLSKGLLHP